jgi:Protein-L-isoaspartate(D-aspartate) O-methyltransferase (PCMT)
MTTDLHQRLVDDLAGKGLLDNPRLRAAFQAICREHFLSGVEPERVYQDDAVTTQTGPGGMTTSSSSQPSIMALMLAQLDPQPGDRVLEIGAGTGYTRRCSPTWSGRAGRSSPSTLTLPSLRPPKRTSTGPALVPTRLPRSRCAPVTADWAAPIAPPSTGFRLPWGCGTSLRPGPTSLPRPGPWWRRCGCAPACTSRPPSPARTVMSDCAVVRSRAVTSPGWRCS